MYQDDAIHGKQYYVAPVSFSSCLLGIGEPSEAAQRNGIWLEFWCWAGCAPQLAPTQRQLQWDMSSHKGGLACTQAY